MQYQTKGLSGSAYLDPESKEGAKLLVVAPEGLEPRGSVNDIISPIFNAFGPVKEQFNCRIF